MLLSRISRSIQEDDHQVLAWLAVGAAVPLMQCPPVGYGRKFEFGQDAGDSSLTLREGQSGSYKIPTKNGNCISRVHTYIRTMVTILTIPILAVRNIITW